MEVPQPMTPVCPRCESPYSTVRCANCKLVVHRVSLFRLEPELLYRGGLGLLLLVGVLVLLFVEPLVSLLCLLFIAGLAFLFRGVFHAYHFQGWTLAPLERLFLLFLPHGRFTLLLAGIIWLPFIPFLGIQMAQQGARLESFFVVLGGWSLGIPWYRWQSTFREDPLNHPETLGITKTLYEVRPLSRRIPWDLISTFAVFVVCCVGIYWLSKRW